MADDGYNFYRAAVAGQSPPIDHNAPQYGFWLRTHKHRPATVVAIFPNEGELYAVEIHRDGDATPVPLEPVPGKDNIQTLTEIWKHLATRPLNEPTWEYYKEHRRLPTDIGEGHNQPPLKELLADQIHSAAEEAMREIAGGIHEQLQADRAANHRDRMLRLKDQADSERKAEKAPHIEAGRAVDERWKPAIAEADNAVMFLRNALTPFLRAQKQAAQEAAPDAEVKVKAGTGKRRTGLRTIVGAKVVDYEAVAIALLRMNNLDIRAEIQRLADKVVRAGGELDGVLRIEREQAQ